MSTDGHSAAFVTPLARPALDDWVEKHAAPVLAYARDYPAGWDTGPHRHGRSQLVYARAGLIEMHSPAGCWLIPPQRAAWVPAGGEHRLVMRQPVELRTLYLRSSPSAERFTEPFAIAVEPLLRALVLRLLARGGVPADDAPGERLLAVLLDELAAAQTPPFSLPFPQEARLRPICLGLWEAPDDDRDLAAWGRIVGASPRTLARLFRRETGMTFAGWRQQARLLQALALLAEGRPVTAVAYDVGYESPSAFIAAFRIAFGATPRRLADLS